MQYQNSKMLLLEDILNEKQISHILKQTLGNTVCCTLKKSEVRPASKDIAGFLGDHLKAVLDVDVEGETRNVHLFLKCIPASNKPKADYIDKHNYYRREVLMYKVLEYISDDDPNLFYAKAYIYTDSILVMPDLTVEGYTSRHFLYTLDAQHVFLTTTAIARLHAAFVNYETQKSIDFKRPYSTYQEFKHVLTEPIYYDSPWLKAAAKLSTNLLKKFSNKSYRNMPDLESKLYEVYLEACDSLTEYKDTVNVLLHKDLWVNNIMFKYEDGAPTNAVLVDYQCLRYGPPAFDLMIFLYFTTDQCFRQNCEQQVFDHYYSVFFKNLNEIPKKRLADLGYDKNVFVKWCERARMFGMVDVTGTIPYVLMDPKVAVKAFNDPETFEKYCNEDRSEPVLAHAATCAIYRQRNLEICEEFVERYVLKDVIIF